MTATEQFEQWRSQRRKRHVLTNLKISEVSSVDRGAGRGVKIVMMKRGDQRVEPMENEDMSALENAEMAIKMYPTSAQLLSDAVERIAKMEGVSLQEAHASDWGKLLLKASHTAHLNRITVLHACGDGFEVAQRLSKADANGYSSTGGGPHGHESDNDVSNSRHLHNQHHTNAGQEQHASRMSAAKTLHKLAEEYAKEFGGNMSKGYDVAIERHKDIFDRTKNY